MSKAVDVFININKLSVFIDENWWTTRFSLMSENINSTFGLLRQSFLKMAVYTVDTYSPLLYNKMKNILYKNGLSLAIVQSLQDKGKKSLIQTWVNDVKDNSASSSPDKKKGLVTGILIVFILMITYLIIYFI